VASQTLPQLIDFPLQSRSKDGGPSGVPTSGLGQGDRSILCEAERKKIRPLTNSSAMLKQDNLKTRKEAYELPRLAIGDILLVGKFKNRKAIITGFTSDENNQPVAQTDKGDHKIFKSRIAKLMPAKLRSDSGLG
jgi:hypothetical protein